MIALSIRQPWAWLIMSAGKDIENRNWLTKYRGPVLVHAAKGMTEDEYYEAVAFVAEEVDPSISIPNMEELQRGGIVGKVDIVDCATSSPSRWFVGKYGFVLAEPHPLPFFPCRGALGFFNVEVQ
ncbi:MAG: ASCH domain-containing protein [Verrucomicrobiae bacterium]|nr:ASCH domain-containing protein [Verrucomicrobiae bacterium]